MSSPIGFPAQPRQAAFARMVRALRADSLASQVETVTGRNADVSAALDGRISEVLKIEQGLETVDQRKRLLALAEARTETTQASLDQLRILTDELVNQVQTTLSSGSTNSLATVAGLARETLSAALSALEVGHGGRILFAGNDGSSGALADRQSFLDHTQAILSGGGGAGALRAAFDDPGGLFETDLYLGGTGPAPLVEIADGERLDLSARADEQPIRDLLRGISAIAVALDPGSGIANEDGRAIAEQALGDLRNAVDPLNQIQARIGTGQQRMETARVRTLADETALTISHRALTGRDPFEAAAELTSLQTQLETLLVTTAQFGNLSLARYL